MAKDWVLPDEWREWALRERPDLDPDRVAEAFRDHWVAAPGKSGRKASWEATWRNWVRNERPPRGAAVAGAGGGASAETPRQRATRERVEAMTGGLVSARPPMPAMPLPNRLSGPTRRDGPEEVIDG